MAKTIEELTEMMLLQLKRRGYPPNEVDILLRLGEEVGEVMEAVRERQPREQLGYELIDVLWNLLRLADLKEIDLEKAFLAKLRLNELRPMEGEDAIVA